MKYFLPLIILFLAGSYYLVASGKANYIARAHVSEALINFGDYENCLSKSNEVDTSENCIFKESEFYKVDYSGINHVLVDFNFETQKHGTSISKNVKGVIKLFVSNPDNLHTIKCVNISLKSKFLPPNLCQGN